MTHDITEPTVVFHTTEGQDMEGRPVTMTLLELPNGDFQMIFYQDGRDEIVWHMTPSEYMEYSRWTREQCQMMRDAAQ